jgi:predicted nuclease with TOPRIM domain
LTTLKERLKEAIVQEDQLKQSRRTLENEITDLKLKFSVLHERYNCRSQSDHHIFYCITAIGRCRKNIEKAIDFITSAVQGQFLDPSLLFSSDQTGN